MILHKNLRLENIYFIYLIPIKKKISLVPTGARGETISNHERMASQALLPAPGAKQFQTMKEWHRRRFLVAEEILSDSSFLLFSFSWFSPLGDKARQASLESLVFLVYKSP